jgi:hypothetical protein
VGAGRYAGLRAYRELVVEQSAWGLTRGALSIDIPGCNSKGGDPLQNERDEVGRTRVVDVRTALEEAWPDWGRERLLGFFVTEPAVAPDPLSRAPGTGPG